jgi:hypothetical protein
MEGSDPGGVWVWVLIPEFGSIVLVGGYRHGWVFVPPVPIAFLPGP